MNNVLHQIIYTFNVSLNSHLDMPVRVPTAVDSSYSQRIIRSVIGPITSKGRTYFLSNKHASRWPPNIPKIYHIGHSRPTHKRVTCYIIYGKRILAGFQFLLESYWNLPETILKLDASSSEASKTITPKSCLIGWLGGKFQRYREDTR